MEKPFTNHQPSSQTEKSNKQPNKYTAHKKRASAKSEKKYQQQTNEMREKNVDGKRWRKNINKWTNELVNVNGIIRTSEYCASVFMANKFDFFIRYV